MGELRKIPNVGKQTEQDLIRMGYTTIQSLRGKSADELYAEECASRGCVVDRCQLYLYRAVEYFVNTENPDPRKCKWWYWKDDYVEVKTIMWRSRPVGPFVSSAQAFRSTVRDAGR